MKNSFLKILSNTNFAKIWFSLILSLVSAYTLNFTLIGKIFKSTQSSVAIAFFLFFYYLPTIILGPFIGVLIDNLNKRLIFAFSSLLQSLIVLSYMVVEERVWPLYAIVLFYSFCDELFYPSVGASLPSIVKKEQLPLANSLFLFTGQSAIVFGSLVGGLLLKFFGNSNLIFGFVSILLLFSALISLSLPKEPFKSTKKIKIDLTDPLNISQTFDLPGFSRQLKEGYNFLKNEPRVLFPILLLAGLQVLTGMALIIFPSLSSMLRIEFSDSSLLIIFPAIFGSVIGTIVVQKRVKKIRKYIFILTGLYFSGAGIFILPILSLLFSKPIFYSLLILVGLGVAYIFMYVPLQTLIQEHTPFKIRGRVFGFLSTIVTLASALPMLITTTLIDIFGIRLILFILGGGILFLATLARSRYKTILSINNNG